MLNQVDADGFDWQVPGLREELVTALIRSLPKAIRRNFVPAPNCATSALSRIGPADGPLLEVLARELERAGPVEVPPEAFDLAGARPPADHLPGGRPGARPSWPRPGPGGGRGQGPGRAQAAAGPAGAGRHRRRRRRPGARPGLTTWDLGTLPRVVEERSGGRAVKAYPALVDEGDSVAVRLFETEAEQAAAMWAGTRRLLLLNVPSPAKFVLGRLTNQAKLALSRNPHGSATDLFDDCVAAAADDLIAANGGPAWDEAGFGRLLAAVRAELAGATLEVVSGVEQVLAVAGEVEGRLAELANPAFAPAAADVRAQLDDLVYPGWVTATGRRRLPDVLRYVRAMKRRLDRLPGDLAADADRMESVARVTDAWRRAADRPPATRPDPARPGRDPLDAGGAARQLLRPVPRHRPPGLGEAGPPRDRPPRRLSRPVRLARRGRQRAPAPSRVP